MKPRPGRTRTAHGRSRAASGSALTLTNTSRSRQGPRARWRGTEGLGLFMIPRVLPDGRVNALRYRRLKDKLGTRSLPTAEIDFEGATAYAIGEVGDGFKTLMNYVINASRLHNAANACGFLHRAFLESRNYARQREAFSQPIINYPLIQETLVTLLERSWRGAAAHLPPHSPGG